jgi:hypothetical protein
MRIRGLTRDFWAENAESFFEARQMQEATADPPRFAEGRQQKQRQNQIPFGMTTKSKKTVTT